jgi:hypothetical protein
MQGKLPVFEIQYLIYVRAYVVIGDIGAIFHTCTSPYLSRCYRDHILDLYESISCEVLQGPYLRFIRAHILRCVTGNISQICTSPYLARCYRNHISDLYESVSCEMLKGPSLIFVRGHILRSVKKEPYFRTVQQFLFQLCKRRCLKCRKASTLTGCQATHISVV